MFRLMFSNDVFSAACGGEYFSISGTIASPMYPESYPINSECIWQLKTSPGNRIRLTFSVFEIETSPNCDSDYLEIREKSGIGPLIGIYCNELPGAVEASTELWIKFRSDNSGTAKGFLGEYNLIHGNELTGVSGEIASPLYPLPWKQDLSISWRITVDFGMAVKIEFDDVHIENYGDYCASKIVVIMRSQFLHSFTNMHSNISTRISKSFFSAEFRRFKVSNSSLSST